MSRFPWQESLALLLIYEGLLPLLLPQQWRQTLLRVLQYRDGQLRFFGLLAVLAGVILLWC
ncbi:DUF2065 domain-containing protein [Leeia aquatica]|uniref:DUF2065 domain-containing protein n=1 Tax=Leeia aquatica TaxID=2725557 RepID=A0A847S962_9NEIS|nr:DUF2065 domain-containing protein [Leeia aquatica]NLR75395.1 DUF2065 domain-containing protein [Leeia aquatica]